MYNRRSDDIIAAFNELEQHIERLHERCRKLELENRQLRGANARRPEHKPASQQKQQTPSPQQKGGASND